MTAEVDLLRLIRKRDAYDKFNRYIKSYALYPETATLVEDIGEYFKYHPEEIELDWTTFQSWFRINKHPGWKKEQHQVYKLILDNVATKDTADPEIIKRFIELDYATRINEEITRVFAESNTDGMSKITDIVFDFDSSRELTKGEDVLVEMDAEKLFEKLWRPEDGVEWRLEDLNRSIGPVRKGDLVLIGKRPEVGGTTFITSEFTHMVTQLPEGKDAIIFNNEEIGAKIGVRLIQSALDITVPDIMADPKAAQAGFLSSLKGRNVHVYHDTSLSVADIERTLRSGRYGLVGINILDKVSGFYKLEGVDRLRALSQWTRKLADKYGIIFVVAQADASAEGVRYLDQSQLYGSKTGMQAESDIQLMIGKDNNPGYENTRYFSIVRNKTPGGPRSDPSLRHGKFECEFDGECARFRSKSWPMPK